MNTLSAHCKAGGWLATLALLAAALAACTTPARRAEVLPPYPPSRVIRSVRWDFASMGVQRKALGSDLWPCAWAADGNLYCAWGDGGGFDGNDDRIGRVSLGFARVEGTPSDDPKSVAGKNVWGAPPYAEMPATFGGKVGSIIAMQGMLYAHGGFWTRDDAPDPTQRSGRGPHGGVAWSTDAARTWQIAPWSSPMPLGDFVDVGQDGGAAPAYVYVYYVRAGDDRNLYLERIHSDSLNVDPRIGGAVEYWSGPARTHEPRWSGRESDARPVFSDRNHVQGPSAVYDAGLGRYILTLGHYASGNDDDSSAGQVGMFEAPHPWGPWSTVGYYEDWGGLRRETTGDFLSLRIPSKWISADGASLWAVFSGLESYDSFNLVHAVLEVKSAAKRAARTH